ncbi:MAG: hypothetical protein KAJ00_10650 [Deltaproteobacteria bacterium]|nr:hypothetical protein [Deltaproteobacteria bacterium]
MKKSLVLIIFLSCLITSTPLAASPLYGGYNGESQLWTDVFFFGMDDQARWWIRIPVTLVPGSLRLIFKYESTGVVSAEIAGSDIPSFAGGSDFLFGADTSGLFWTEYNDEAGLLSGGSDSNGNSWTEQALFDYFGTGSDNNEHLWGFVTYKYENTFSMKAGMNLSFLMPEPESSIKSKSSLVQTQHKKIPSLTNLFKHEEGLKLVNFPTALSLNDELEEKVATLTMHSLDLESLLKFADEEIFTQERRKAIEGMINGFIDAGDKK